MQARWQQGCHGTGRDASCLACPARLHACTQPTRLPRMRHRSPAELAEALKAGKLPEEILQRFLDMDKNPFLSWLMRIG